MATIQPLTALRYEQSLAGPLEDLVTPPYDVIDDEQRAQLAARSPYNAVHVDLPEAAPGDPRHDPYTHAAKLLKQWLSEGALVRETEPAIWALTQDHSAPDGRRLTRRGLLCAARVEPYGAGRIRPHERTHPGPKEDRLRLTRATAANLSPIFSLYSDPGNSAWAALEPHTRADAPFGEAAGDDGTVNRVWRVTDPDTLAEVVALVAESELLIADGHHRYETARAYASEIGGEGPHRWVLMHLVALEDPGLTVLPTHRLLTGIEDDPDRQDQLDRVLRESFDVEELPDEQSLVPEPAAAEGGRTQIGYMDARAGRPYMLTLKDPAIADAALAEHAEPYRRLDTALLEALILKRALGLTDEQIDHKDGLDYARDFDAALAALHGGEHDAGFFMGATPVAGIQEVAGAGECMPPKSTYFSPKVPTGLLFNPLDR